MDIVLQLIVSVVVRACSALRGVGVRDAGMLWVKEKGGIDEIVEILFIRGRRSFNCLDYSRG